MKKNGDVVVDGDELYLIWDGARVAKRGKPGTPQAKTWIALVPGYHVIDIGDGIAVSIDEGYQLQ
jgi:hypothetical protein